MLRTRELDGMAGDATVYVNRFRHVSTNLWYSFSISICGLIIIIIMLSKEC